MLSMTCLLFLLESGNLVGAVVIIVMSFLDDTQSGLAVFLLTVGVGFSGIYDRRYNKQTVYLDSFIFSTCIYKLCLRKEHRIMPYDYKIIQEGNSEQNNRF